MTTTVDYRNLLRDLTVLPRDVELAAIRCLNRAGATAGSLIAKDVSAGEGINPQSLIRRRLKLMRANYNRAKVTVRLLVTPIPAIRLSGVRDKGMARTGGRKRSGERVGQHLFKQVGGGVSAGKRSWPHAFIAEGRGGHTMVFQRKGPKRKPLEAVKVDIRPKARVVMQARGAEIPDRVTQLMDRELVYRVKKRAGVL